MIDYVVSRCNELLAVYEQPIRDVHCTIDMICGRVCNCVDSCFSLGLLLRVVQFSRNEVNQLSRS